MPAERVLKLRLRQFRCYQALEVDLNFDLVFFTGDNGAGKTSVIEAIGLMSFLKSFRGAKDQALLHWGSDFFSLDLEFSDSAKKEQLRLAYGKNPGSDAKPQRKMVLGSDKVLKSAEFLGRFQAVVFSPDDIDIVDTTPAARRKYIDMLLSTLYPEYFTALRTYNHALAMRSTMLRQTRTNDPVYFRAVERELAQTGSFIQNQRMKFAAEFQEPFSRYVSLISGNQDGWQIVFRPSIEKGETPEAYAEALAAARTNDLRIRQNTRGVHRDNWQFLNGKAKRDLQEVASQGQKRTAALSLKMAQFAYTRKATGRVPVLLIDDVLNELDVDRRKRYIEFLNETGQALITTTDLSGMQDFVQKKSRELSVAHFHVKAGDRSILERVL